MFVSVECFQHNLATRRLHDAPVATIVTVSARRRVTSVTRSPVRPRVLGILSAKYPALRVYVSLDRMSPSPVDRNSRFASNTLVRPVSFGGHLQLTHFQSGEPMLRYLAFDLERAFKERFWCSMHHDTSKHADRVYMILPVGTHFNVKVPRSVC